MKIPGFREVPKTGVIYVTHEAFKLGYGREEGWANLGQGSPETGEIPGQSHRPLDLRMEFQSREYSPVSGIRELREAVANYYNELYRQGKSSRYTYENVSIAGGGRTALSRVAASLGHINIGYFIPDYTAYEELLEIFKAFHPIPILLKNENNYQFTAAELAMEIRGRGLSAFLMSNPQNPTGRVTQGEELKEWVEVARNFECTLIMDEFYSHYTYDGGGKAPVSAAAYVEDVNRDPIVIVDGPTKNWRYPGWRLSWTVAPKSVIEATTSAGSFLDGGPVHPLQMAAIPLLDPEFVRKEYSHLRGHFQKKRDFLVKELEDLGFKTVPGGPAGTFYCWVDLSQLPGPLQNGLRFFEEGLKEKFITVPGIFFDVNPGKRRSIHHSLYKSFTRISFGPGMDVLQLGLEKIHKVIRKF